MTGEGESERDGMEEWKEYEEGKGKEGSEGGGKGVQHS
jgi:hypothetical protein